MGRLFREGIEELRLALADASFIEAHIPGGRRSEVASFRAKLSERWARETPADAKGAGALLSEVAPGRARKARAAGDRHGDRIRLRRLQLAR